MRELTSAVAASALEHLHGVLDGLQTLKSKSRLQIEAAAEAATESPWLKRQQERVLARLRLETERTETKRLHALQLRLLSVLGEDDSRAGRAFVVRTAIVLCGTALLLVVLVVARAWLFAQRPPIDEGARIRLKMAELSERLEQISQPLVRCRDAASLTPLPPGKWCYELGLAECETHSVQPARGGGETSRVCVWNAGARTCEARPASGLLCNPAQLVAMSSKCKALATLGGGALPRFVAVVSHWKEDVRWTEQLPMPALIYDHGPSFFAKYSVPSNAGNEASAYLQFIVDHYTCLPPWMLFLHGHGSTPSHRSRGSLGTAKSLEGRERRHHPLEPAASSALLDVDRIDRGFLAVGHYSSSDWSKVSGGSRSPDPDQHALGFVTTERAQPECTCHTLQRLFSNATAFDCQRGWGYPLGGTFWANKRRVRHRPLSFWRNALRIALASKHASIHGARCFAALWHHLLGEPLHNYQPPYATFEQLPVVSAASRQAATQQRIPQTDEGLSTCGGGGASPACAHGTPKARGEDPYCPGRCTARDGEEVDRWLRESGFELANPWVPARLKKKPRPPQCDLCGSRSLFIVAAGGRTGSTSLLSMLQAHPSLWLAGENGDQLGMTLKQWLTAAVQDDASVGAWKRDPVDARNLLCNVQQWFRSIAPGGPAEAIRGFKEIRWGGVPIPLEPFMKWRLRNASQSTFVAGARDKVRFLADLLFPCSKVVFVVRRDAAAWRASMQRNWHSDGAQIQSLFDQAIEAREAFRKLHDEWHAGGKAWHSFWLPLEDFESGGLNRMLDWLGETGCRFAGSVHYNRQGFEGQQLDSSIKLKQARTKLQGKCHLSPRPGDAFLAVGTNSSRRRRARYE